ncbi:alpha/beta hydrolase fold domain-containing protein [Nocardiopsis protaetiae]|uniref:alpha/beta hydrolase fold domain-containing protein n=1 Tax=Nocardiopsis protaetiae TaxID=3382270 RepID=UPI00387B5FAB
MSVPPEPGPGRPRRPRRRRVLLALGVTGVVLALVAGYTARTYGDRPLEVTDAQRAAMSEEAARHLDGMRPIFLPDFLVSTVVTEERLAREAAAFEEQERPVQDELIERYSLTVEDRTVGGVPVLVVTPPEIAPGQEGRIALNVHGGGFFLGSARERVGLMLAHELGMPVYSVNYTLSPEAVYPQAVNEVLAVYRELVAEHDPADVIAFGSSSGGNLLASAVLAAAEEGLPMAAALALFTPITDLTGIGDSVEANDRRDGLVANLRIDVPGRVYAGDEPLDSPGVSPVYADFPADFPPTVLTAGTRDMNLSDNVRLSWRLEEAGVENRLLVSEGMWHGHHWEVDLPEAVRTRAAAAGFLREHLDAADG